MATCKADLSITVNRSDLERVMMGVETLQAQIASGVAKAEGDAGIVATLASLMVDFDPRFEVMPGTKMRPAAPGPSGDLEAVVGAAIPE